jgi:ATP-binding cassette subfamily B protein
MKKGICVKQRDITDCGAACLVSIAAFYKLHYPVSKIRQYAGTDQRGTNVLGIIEASAKLGLVARGARGKAESLDKIPLPAILHVTVDNLNHYVVAYKVSKQRIIVMDPAEGRMIRYKKNEFLVNWSGVVILMEPGDAFQTGNKVESNLNRFMKLVAPHRSVMLQAVIGAVVYTILGLATSIYVQKIVDHVLVDGNTRLLNLLSVVMIIFLVFQLIIGNTKSILAIQTGQRIDAKLILGYYKHILRLPQQFFDTMRVGEIISRINDAVKIRNFVNETAISLVVNIMIIVFSVTLMFFYYWKLALIMLTIIPVYFVIYLCSDYFSNRQQRLLMEDSAALETQLVESLNAAGTLKKFSIEAYASAQTENRFMQLLRSIYRAAITNLYVSGFSEITTRLYTIVLLWAGSYYVIERELSPGELLSFYALIGYLTTPASALVGANRSIRDALIAADRLYEIIDLDHEQHRELDLAFIAGDIKFQNACFRYGTRTAVFESLDLNIRIGTKTAIVGESGSGKSTIAALLLKLYELQSGNIFIGSHNISHINARNLRNHISVVPQQIELFAGTIIENIALGCPTPDLEKLIFICQVTGLHEFIQQLPMHYHSVLSEQGVNLSGGQRQKLAIARALYRDPEILILDEATSSLDAESEQQVQRAFDWFMSQNKTLIIIAHRLSTIRNCDEILVLLKGKLAESGTHDQLITNNGYYRALWGNHPVTA